MTTRYEIRDAYNRREVTFRTLPEAISYFDDKINARRSMELVKRVYRGPKPTTGARASTAEVLRSR